MTSYEGIKQLVAAEAGGVPAQGVAKRAKTVQAHAAIRNVIVDNPTLRYEDIAALLGVSRWLVYTVAKEFRVRRKKGAGSTAFKK